MDELFEGILREDNLVVVSELSYGESCVMAEKVYVIQPVSSDEGTIMGTVFLEQTTHVELHHYHKYLLGTPLTLISKANIYATVTSRSLVVIISTLHGRDSSPISPSFFPGFLV